MVLIRKIQRAQPLLLLLMTMKMIDDPHLPSLQARRSAFANALMDRPEWYTFDLIDQLGALRAESLDKMPAEVLTGNNTFVPSTIINDDAGPPASLPPP